MLVLNRKKGESLIIGENIEITIIDIQGDQAKIGIEAPREINICRKEIYLEITNANRQANLTNPIEKISQLKNLKPRKK